MKPSTSAALIPASSRQALMHSKCSECVLASGRLPTLVSATPTIAYFPLRFAISPPLIEHRAWANYCDCGREYLFICRRGLYCPAQWLDKMPKDLDCRDSHGCH